MNDRQINQADILALLRLGNYLHELPANPIVRQEHMLAELCGMIGAPFGVSALLDVRPIDKPSLQFLVYHGIDDAARQSKLYQCVRSMEDASTRPTSLMQLLGLPKPIATHSLGLNGFAVDVPRRKRTAQQNGQQNGQHGAQPDGMLRLGDSVTSMLQLRREQLISVISFRHNGNDWGNDRGNDRRVFTQRDRQIVRLFHSQIEWMFSEHLPSESPSTFDSLTPRQQQTLRYLLSGDSEKQIAHKLARSPHTVHAHVKSIYRNLGVSSRGELLSLFVR